MPPAARVGDPTQHGPPLNPGIGSLTVLIGNQPAWRALPAGVGSGLDSASDTMKSLMDAPVLTPADATPKLVQVQTGMAESAGKAGAEGNAAAAGATSGAFATLTTVNTTLTTAWTTASAAPGGQPAANTAYTEGIKAAAAAAASAAMAAVAGMTDTHICPNPCPIPPHGPGVVTKGSSTVLIDGLPAVRQDDKVVEACGGPDPIAKGCDTVLIGDDGGGGGSGGGGGGGGEGDGGVGSAAGSGGGATQAEEAAVAEALQQASESGAPLVEIQNVDPTTESTELATIEFRVVNEEDGVPRSGVRLLIRGPDEKEYDAVTDTEGRAVLRGVPDGDYAITDTREAPTLEARRVQSSPRPPA